MRCVATISTHSPDDVLRDVGVTLAQLFQIRDQVVTLMLAEQTRWSMKRRGKHSSHLTVEDTLLLTLTSLRHDPTFQQLGGQFGMSES